MKTVTNREDWLEKRKKGIGASEASCILGLNHWKTNVDLWKEKTGQREPEDIGDKDCVMYGKKAEELVRGLFELDYPGYMVEYDEFGMIANRPNEPWLFATLDGHIIGGNKNGVLEIKTTTIQQSSQWELDKYPNCNNENEWAKMVATIKSDKYLFDVHWYEYDGIQYEMKLKFRKENKQ